MGEEELDAISLKLQNSKRCSFGKTFGSSCHMFLKICWVTFDDDAASADKEDEKVWSRNAFALVVSPLLLACFPYFPSHPLVWGWLAPPCMGLAPPLYGARTLFYPFLSARAPLISCAGGDGEKATSTLFCFSIQSERPKSGGSMYKRCG